MPNPTYARTATPISTVQKQKLMELYRTLNGGAEEDAITGLDQLFGDAFKCKFYSATYEQGARMTAQLLNELRNRPTLAPAVPPPTQTAPNSQPVAAEKTPDAQPSAPAAVLPESPFSWNTTANDGDGWEEQFTIRALTGNELMHRVGTLKKYLKENGYKPTPRFQRTAASATAATNEENPICAIHKTPMAKRQGKNGSFWSCPQKLEDGTFCPYRPKSQ